MRRPWSAHGARHVTISCLAMALAAAPVAAAPATSLSAGRETFADDFSVPGAWAVVDDEAARIAYGTAPWSSP